MASRAQLRFKNGVIAYKVHPALHSALITAANLFHEMFRRPLTVTSLADSKHSAGSRHYPAAKTGWMCGAADLRVWGLTQQQRVNFALALGDELGVDYDVIDEEDHVHVEYDPEGP